MTTDPDEVKIAGFDNIPEHQFIIRLLVSTALFLGSVYVAMDCYAKIDAWPWQLNYPTAVGRVTNITRRSTGRSAYLEYAYEFSLSGKTFTGTDYEGKTLDNYVKVGQEVKVRYEPEDPSKSIMCAGFNRDESPFLIVVSISLLVAANLYASGKIKSLQ